MSFFLGKRGLFRCDHKIKKQQQSIHQPTIMKLSLTTLLAVTGHSLITGISARKDSTQNDATQQEFLIEILESYIDDDTREAIDLGPFSDTNRNVDPMKTPKLDQGESNTAGLRGGGGRKTESRFVDLAVEKPNGRTPNTVFITDQVGDWSSMPSKIGNDALTYVNTWDGRMIELWEHSNFGGKVLVIGDYDEKVEILDLSSLGFNDIASSFRIRDIPSNLSAKFCKDLGCTSGSYLAPLGSYSSMPAAVGNDALTTILVPPGFKVWVFKDSNFEGGRVSFSNTHATAWGRADLTEHGLNDVVSSFAVTVV